MEGVGSARPVSSARDEIGPTPEDVTCAGWAQRLMEMGWLAAAVLVPLVFNPVGISAFELPKALLLRALVLLMALMAFVWVLERKERLTWSRSPIIWAAVGLGFLLVLSTIFSVDPRLSFWGSRERQQGLVTVGGYLLLLFVVSTGLRTCTQRDRLFAALSWTSLPIVVYGLLQALGVDPLNWMTDAVSPVLSTIGRANFLGSYLVLIIPVTLALALSTRWRIPYFVLLALQVVCLALTQARAAWLGLLAALFIFGLLWAWVTRERWLGLTLVALMIVAVVGLATVNLVDGPRSLLANTPVLGRLTTFAQTQEGSTAARLTIWRTSARVIAERPLLGFGPETWRPIFAQHFPPELVYYQGRQVTVDRAHNVLLDWAWSTGVLGTLAFLALLLAFLRTAFRHVKGALVSRSQIVWIALIAAVLGHFFDLFFAFELTASATVFYLLLGTAVAMDRGLEKGAGPVLRRPAFARARPFVLPGLSVLILVGVVSVPPLVADSASWQAMQSNAELSARLAAAETAVRCWPLEPEYRLQLGVLRSQAGLFEQAEEDIAVAVQERSGDPQTLIVQGDLYLRWGEQNPTMYARAEAAFRRALALAPDVAAYHVVLSQALVKQGQFDEAIGELEAALRLDSTDVTAYLSLADLYTWRGRPVDAEWARKEAEITMRRMQ